MNSLRAFVSLDPSATPRSHPLASEIFSDDSLGARALRARPRTCCATALQLTYTKTGADLMIIQTLLGHVELQTTARYAQSSAFKLIETFDRCHPLGALHEKPTEN